MTLHLRASPQAGKRARSSRTLTALLRERKTSTLLLNAVRAFYLDIQQVALEDPTGCRGLFPTRCAGTTTHVMSNARRKTRAARHQRVRERLPHLPALPDAAGLCSPIRPRCWPPASMRPD